MKPSHTTWEAVRWPIFWASVIGGLGVFDAYRATKHDGSTLSECTRRLFRTDGPPGQALFRACLEVGAAELTAHILREQQK
jgi:hypothetical protein